MLKDETRSTIIAIVFFVLAIFFIMAAFWKAGPVGNFIHTWLSLLLGYGFFLLPLLFVLLGVSFMRTVGLHIATRIVVGSVLFVLSGLGTLAMFSQTAGGIFGGFIMSPLVKLFDVYFTGFLLVALFVLSIIILLDTAPRGEHFARLKEKLFPKKEKKEEEVPVVEPIPVVPVITEPQFVSVPLPATLVEPVKEVVPEEIPPQFEEEKLPVPEPKKPSMMEEFFGSDEEEDDDQEDEIDGSDYVDLPVKEFIPPPLNLLEGDKGKPGVGDMKANSNIIRRTLANFGIIVEMDEISIGPSVTRYALKPAEGVKLSRIVGLQNELALALAAHPVRIEAPIPGTSLVGVEVPNSTKTTVALGTLFAAPEFSESHYPLLMSLGKSISGKSHFGNLAKMPHMRSAGTTGSGKSVAVLSMITSLLYRNPPENLRFILIDPKRVTLPMFNGIPHLLTPVITDAKKTLSALRWATREMDRRYQILETEKCVDIQSYHEEILGAYLKKKHRSGVPAGQVPERMPFIVIMVDELADLMQAYPRELEGAIVRLAQMSRAVGIHLVLSTQRPSVNVITGLIKANIPTRMALRVISQIDSRTILDASGAEKLLGSGDMLYQGDGMSKPIRLQSAFISDTEIKKVVKYIVDEYRDVPPEYIAMTDVPGRDSIFSSMVETDDSPGDDLYEEVKQEVIRAGKASTSYIQRKFGIGYSRAAKLIDSLEEHGVVGPGQGSKPREVLEGGGSGGGSTIGRENDDSDIENEI